MKADKVIVIPANQRQLENWIQRLEDAGCSYTELNYKGKDVLEVERIDAINILGQTQLKKTSNKKVAAIVLGSLLVLGWIGSLADKAENTVAMGATEPLSADERRRQDSIRTIEQKATALADIENIKAEMNGINRSDYQGSVEAVAAQVATFHRWVKVIEDAERSPDPVIVASASKLRKSVAAIQTKEFPRLRAEFAKQTGKMVWRDDVDVVVIGKTKSTIRFIGGTFAANANKEDFQKNIGDALEKLRFKQAQYLWHQYDDEYTYWTLTTAKDSDLVSY